MRNPALWLDNLIGLKNHTIAHYAWVIIAIAGVVQMVGAAIRMAFGVLVDPLVQAFDWSPGSIGLAYALMSITTALASPVAGYLGNRFGARRTMVAGTGLFFIGMMWTSQVEQIWELYLAYGLVFGIAQALLLVPVIPSVATWFAAGPDPGARGAHSWRPMLPRSSRWTSPPNTCGTIRSATSW